MWGEKVTPSVPADAEVLTVCFSLDIRDRSSYLNTQLLSRRSIGNG